MEDLETGVLEFEIVRELLEEIKKKFGEINEELVKIVELEQVE